LTAGTKIPGTASRHKAMRYGDMQQAVERLREAMAALVRQAHPQDESDARPAELARRADRGARSEAARRRWEAQAKAAAHAERQRPADAAVARQRPGQQRRGTAPTPVEAPPDDTAQRHLTEPALPSRRTTNKGWESGANAQARVAAACQIIVACDVRNAPNDTPQAEPLGQATLATLAEAGIELPTEASGAPAAMPATLDHGYSSEAAGQALEA
jgi:hypothetical protein